MDVTAWKHKADALDARTVLGRFNHTHTHTGLAERTESTKKTQNKTNTKMTTAHPDVGVRLHTHFSDLYTALHASGGSVVQTGAVAVVGGVDVHLLVLASLQSRTRPAQDQLAEERKPQTHTQHYASVLFGEINGVFRPAFGRRVCTCRQSARSWSSLSGRASRGDSAPADSSRIIGPWHSTWRQVSLCTLRLLGLPSLLNRKDLYDAGSKEGNINSTPENRKANRGERKDKKETPSAKELTLVSQNPSD